MRCRQVFHPRLMAYRLRIKAHELQELGRDIRSHMDSQRQGLLVGYGMIVGPFAHGKDFR
jgi:hypothetical protein